MSSEALILQYRPSVHRFYRWVIGLTLLAELIIIRMNLFKIMEETWIVGTLSLVLASTVPMSILIRMLFVVRPAIRAQYELLSDRVLIHSGRKQKEFKFSDVMKVNYSWLSPRFFGGFSLELATGQKFRFFSILENSHQVLEFLHEVRNDVFAEKQYQDYIKSSQRVSESWERLSRKLRNWKILLIKYFVFPLLVTCYLWWKGLSLSEEDNFIWIMSLMLLILWSMAGILNHLEERQLLKHELDLAYEAKIDLIVDIVFFCVGIFVSLLIASPLM